VSDEIRRHRNGADFELQYSELETREQNEISFIINKGQIYCGGKYRRTYRSKLTIAAVNQYI